MSHRARPTPRRRRDQVDGPATEDRGIAPSSREHDAHHPVKGKAETSSALLRCIEADPLPLRPAAEVAEATASTLLPDYRFILVVIPAHNEERRIGDTIASLRAQSRPADLVIVALDNCTDDTAAVALAQGAVVFATEGNTHRKAGALNQALDRMLPELGDDDAVLLMDADTTLNPDFIDATTTRLWGPQRGRAVGGVGGIFEAAEGPWSLVTQLQSNEYVRYARQLGRRHGRAMVLTGTGAVFTAATLRTVEEARRTGAIPDESGKGSVYDEDALTEDNELTLAIKALGLRTVSPKACKVFTAMMPTYLGLYQQRRGGSAAPSRTSRPMVPTDTPPPTSLANCSPTSPCSSLRSTSRRSA